jgi:hypothetical protein
MNKTGKIKSTDTKEIFRQFQVNCIGGNDTGKYYMLSVFGEDANIPVDTKALTTGSTNKDINFVVGVLNSLKDDNLNPGDKIIFSSSDDGSEIKSFVKLLNDGTIEMNGNADNIAGFTELKEGFDELVENVNEIIQALITWVPVANDGGAALKTLVTDISLSTANIDDSKKDNLKIE